MTLRKPIEENKDDDNERMQNELKLKAFSDMLKETAKYLILHHSDYHPKKDNPKSDDGSASLIAKYGVYIGAVVVVVNGVLKENMYVKKFYKTLVFGPKDSDLYKTNIYFDGFCNGLPLPMDYFDGFCNDLPRDYDKIDPIMNEIIGDRIENEYGKDAFTCINDWYRWGTYSQLEYIIDQFNKEYSQRYGEIKDGYTRYFYLPYDTMKLNVIFWNLLLCALDDDIYNEQLPLVIELAHCFKLDEHIVADICRAVEYVLSGKKLSEDCNLHCETVECAKFFLGHE